MLIASKRGKHHWNLGWCEGNFPNSQNCMHIKNRNYELWNRKYQEEMFYAFMHKKSSKFSTALHLFSLELRLLRTSLHQPKKNEKWKNKITQRTPCSRSPSTSVCSFHSPQLENTGFLFWGSALCVHSLDLILNNTKTSWGAKTCTLRSPREHRISSATKRRTIASGRIQ